MGRRNAGRFNAQEVVKASVNDIGLIGGKITDDGDRCLSGQARTHKEICQPVRNTHGEGFVSNDK